MSKSGTINELLDMLTYAVAVDALQAQEEFYEGTEAPSKKHLQKGLSLGKQINAKKPFALTLSENWKSLEGEGAKLTGLKRTFGKATNGGFAWKILIGHYTGFAMRLLSNNSKSPMGVGTLFTLTAQWRILKNIAKLVNEAQTETEIATAIGKFSLLMNGKGKATKRLVLWAKSISDFGVVAESLSDDVDKAEREISAGEQLGKAKRKFEESDDPDTRLNAEMELAEAEQNAESVINNSDNPQGAKSRVISQAIQAQKDLGYGVNEVTGYAYKTAVGAKYGLNDEQEKMLTARGKVIMAAGAGSGKTHTLTALIEYMCTPKAQGGMGLRSNQIMVSSFTRAASGEILERVKTRSNVRMAKEPKGFGTVHSLTARNINGKTRTNVLNRKERPLGGKYIGKKEGFYIDQIMLVALRQVAMSGGGKAPNPTNLFTGKEIDFDINDVERGLNALLETQQSLEIKGITMTEKTLNDLKFFLENYYGNALNGYTGDYTGYAWRGGPDRFYQGTKASHDRIVSLLNPSFIDKEGYGKNTKFLFSYSPKYQVGDEISSADVSMINEIYATLPRFSPYKEMSTTRIASAGIKTITAGQKNQEEPIKYFRKEEVKWWDAPSNQWFNIGVDLAKLEELFGKKGEEGKKKEPDSDSGKEMMNVISKASRLIAVLKGKGISPSEAWYKVGGASEVNQIGQFDPYVAVYAAYEWLLGNTEQVPRDGDMTDVLIDAVRVLVRDPQALASLQARYKLILVDEAQDLNKVQHMFFGLIAGTVDPQTLEEKSANEMSATMYAMIGDDKQAIYGFQGADSKEMIGKSDQMGGDFTTNLITTNYRSGKNIVDMANQFIAHNEDQIPMTCKANTQKNGMGEVQLHEVVGVENEGAKQAGAEKVVEILLETKNQQDKDWKSFGVGVRTNAEGELYALMCLQNDIPFKGRYNPLKKKEYKGILSFFKLATYLKSGKVANPVDVLFDISRYPNSFITKKGFIDYFEMQNDPIKDLMRKDYQRKSGFYALGSGKVSALGKRVDDLSNFVISFAKYLSTLETVTSRAVYEYLMGSNDGDEENGIAPSRPPLMRNGKTIVDSIVDEIKKSASEINKLQVPGGEVTEEMIETAARSKFSAFGFLIETGDSMEFNEDTGKEYSAQGTVFDLINFTNKIESLGDGGENSDGDNTDKDDSKVDAVRIMTCHGWKGLECDTMFVPCGMTWPRSDTTTPMTKEQIADRVNNARGDELPPGGKRQMLRDLLVAREEMESERRLMYVAMTRAEQTLHLVHTIAQYKKGDLGSHFFESKEICLEPTSKKSNLLDEWGSTMVDGE